VRLGQEVPSCGAVRKKRGASAVAMAKSMKVFISYSRWDEEFARKLVADLRTEGFLDPWLDVADIKLGDRWETKIEEAITSAELMLVLLSSASVKSQWVIREAELAASKGKGRVIPVIIDEGAKSAVPLVLKQIQWLDLSTPDLYALGLHQLSNLAAPKKTKPNLGQDIKIGDFVEGRIVSGNSLSIAAPNGPRMADILDLDDFVARVAEKLRHQIPTANEETRGHPDSSPIVDPLSNLVFVVMSFEEDMDPIFDGIKAAAESVGLDAKRVKDVIGDYQIDTKLIEMIHKACMVVVDLTHERPNVYFELGYARGIRKTVITTARKGTPVHFDVQSWTCDFYSDSRILEKRLKERFKLEWARLTANTPASSLA
jgi:hypothetical protein